MLTLITGCCGFRTAIGRSFDADRWGSGAWLKPPTILETLWGDWTACLERLSELVSESVGFWKHFWGNGITNPRLNGQDCKLTSRLKFGCKD